MVDKSKGIFHHRISDRKELRKYVKGRVLDIGIKDGYFWNQNKPRNVIGIDLIYYKGFVDLIADARYLPFKDKSFDTTVITEVFEHINPKDREKVIREIERVTKEVVIISAPSRAEINMYDNEKIHPHRKNPSWLFDDESFIKLVDKFEGKKLLFYIRGMYYEGYGCVIFLKR